VHQPRQAVELGSLPWKLRWNILAFAVSFASWAEIKILKSRLLVQQAQAIAICSNLLPTLKRELTGKTLIQLIQKLEARNEKWLNVQSAERK